MKKILLCFVMFGAVSCGPTKQEYEKLLNERSENRKEIVKLQEKISELKKIIENYENTPDRLYYSVLEKVNKKDIEGLSVLCEKLEKYHPASTECQKSKTLLKNLIAQKKAQEKAEKAKRMQIVNKLKKEHDDIDGVTWYKNPYFTHKVWETGMSLYIGKGNYSPWLRLKMSYGGDDWIFFENAYLSYDGHTMEIPFDKYKNKTTDNDGGDVWEWIDISVDDKLYAFLKEMAKGKILKMRLSGKYSQTKTLSSIEKRALQDMLTAYDVLEREK